jgi:hypothetical protein
MCAPHRMCDGCASKQLGPRWWGETAHTVELYEGHCGRPGQRGGSRSKAACGGTTARAGVSPEGTRARASHGGGSRRREDHTPAWYKAASKGLMAGGAAAALAGFIAMKGRGRRAARGAAAAGDLAREAARVSRPRVVPRSSGRRPYAGPSPVIKWWSD